jgi:transcription-repair coupling factor (superfamily II helicase)
LRHWLAATATAASPAWRVADAVSLSAMAVAQCQRFPDRVLLVAADSRRAEALATALLEYQTVTGDVRPVVLIPEVEQGARRQWIPENEAARCAALHALAAGAPGIFIAAVPVLLSPVLSPADFRRTTFALARGQKGVDPETLARRLVGLDYDNEAEVGVPGEFSRRGGIVDLYSPLYDLPVRIEFWGDEIESIRFFSVANQRSVREIDQVMVVPRGLAATGETVASVPVWEYAGASLPLVLCEPEAIAEHLQRFGADADLEAWRGLAARAESVVTLYGPLDVTAPEPLPDAGVLGVAALLELDSHQGVLPWHDRRLRDQLQAWRQAGMLLVACCTGTEEAARVAGLLAADPGLAGLQFEVIHGFSAGGLWLPEQRLVLLGEADLFGRPQEASRSPRRHYEFRRDADGETEWSEPEVGALAVHAMHGICRYHGIRDVEVDGELTEAATLEFADEVKVYVPLEQIDLISRYVGGTKTLPKLAKVGGLAWKKACAAAVKATWDLAAEMLRLEALRTHHKGTRFIPVPDWETAFASSFPYTETPDQRTAINDVLADMERETPMDRLLCGDVGYGKTEVAIRAAFRTVLNHRQVAVLVPTTILAQQHYENFRRRMAEYPVSIEVLSRFRTRGEQREVLDGLAEGRIDIVIGTHRLLQEDIRFNNLGLLVVDEEQRFGVEHKQRLKEWRASVDILTMTATPVPRTLYLSLSGLRNLSTIMTAPVERLPVTTITATYDKALIREAILREIGREGQVYYLHNRVQSIEKTVENLRKLVPEATIEWAHGQMPADDLEDRMIRFVAGKFQVLVCTTIIENGLDIPNANTIIIERSERFGLAELYQLRGRVGRYHHQAYAYLLLPPSGVLPADARQRIAAIRKFTHLGAGFKLAMRDLEIRGAGNILGTQQSGHIAAIGFELYCRLLREAVVRLEKQPPAARRLVPLKLDTLAFGLGNTGGKAVAGIPRSYVGDEDTRLHCYRRLAALETPGAIMDFLAELRDRFGPPPPETGLLVQAMAVRELAASRGILAISVRANLAMLETTRGFYKLVDGRLPRLRATDAASQLRELEALLAKMPEGRR